MERLWNQEFKTVLDYLILGECGFQNPKTSWIILQAVILESGSQHYFEF